MLCFSEPRAIGAEALCIWAAVRTAVLRWHPGGQLVLWGGALSDRDSR